MKEINTPVSKSLKYFGDKSNRFNTIFFEEPLKNEVVGLPVIESGEYVVDDSCFIPMSEAIKQLNRINDPTNGQLAECYDFPNGKDTGKSIPAQRRHDIKDIAEISTEIMNDVKDMTEKAEEIKEDIKRKADFENAISKAKSSSSE